MDEICTSNLPAYTGSLSQFSCTYCILGGSPAPYISVFIHTDMRTAAPGNSAAEYLSRAHTYIQTLALHQPDNRSCFSVLFCGNKPFDLEFWGNFLLRGVGGRGVSAGDVLLGTFSFFCLFEFILFSHAFGYLLSRQSCCPLLHSLSYLLYALALFISTDIAL